MQVFVSERVLTDPTSVIRCVAWANSPGLFCVGTSTGKAILQSFENAGKREIVPKYARACNTVSFNQMEQIAIGLDKVRNDFCTLIYDANNFSNEVEPMLKLSNNEAVVSSGWFMDKPTSLALGTGFKWLRIYDIRSISQPLSVIAHIKAVSLLAIDPHDTWRVATGSDEGIVRLWDLRRLTDPVQFIDTQNKRIDQMTWSPTQKNSLALLCKGETFLRQYDVSQNLSNLQSPKASVSSLKTLEEANSESKMIASPIPSVISSNVISVFRKRNFSFPVASFSTHPRDDQRFIAVNVEDAYTQPLIEEDVLHPKIPISWGQSQVAFVSTSSKSISFFDLKGPEHVDVRVVDEFEMIDRAKKGYGLDASKNSIFFERNQPSLARFWQLISAFSANENFKGIISRLQNMNSLLHTTYPKSGLQSFPVFISAERNAALRSCGWPLIDSENLHAHINQLESNGEFERAIAVAVFGLDTQKALTLLTTASSNNPSNQNFSLVAVALAGFPDHESLKNPNRILWQRTCEICLASVTSPYLRIVLQFLSSLPASSTGVINGNSASNLLSLSFYSSVLTEPKIVLADKIGFALRFLPDGDVELVLKQMFRNCYESGSLDGLLLSGLNNEGFELLQAFCDRTSDIQTAAIISALGSGFEKMDSRSGSWIQIYRSLLDRWRLWHVRAKFDAACTQIMQSNRKNAVAIGAPQIFARCQYCGTPLSLPKLLDPATTSSTNFICFVI